MQSQASWRTMLRTGWKTAYTITSRDCFGTRTLSPGRSCRSPTTLRFNRLVPCTERRYPGRGLRRSFPNEKQKRVGLLVKIPISNKRDVTELQSLTNKGVSSLIQTVAVLSEGKPRFHLQQDAALGWSIYIEQALFEDCKVWKANLEEKKNVKRGLCGENGVWGAQFEWLKEEGMGISSAVACDGLHKLMKDFVYEWGKGWLNQYWILTWRKASFFFF